jgi:hypothetical protein
VFDEKREGTLPRVAFIELCRCAVFLGVHAGTCAAIFVFFMTKSNLLS